MRLRFFVPVAIAALTFAGEAAAIPRVPPDHDVVGFPTGPNHGRDAAQGFYDYLVANFTAEEMAVTRAYYGDDFCVIEHNCTGTVPGEFLGVAGNGRRITFRLLHVWEFRDGLISRENVWLDGGAVIAQLTAPETVGTSA